jgi:hypothetical protein
VQDEKQPSESISTEGGRQIDERRKHNRNAHGPIRETFEGDSNVTSASFVQFERQSSESSSTKAGMQIDESDEHARNADGDIRDN